MVVINRTKEDIRIKELKSIVPADGKKYILPKEIAFKYKAVLIPVQMSDSFLDEKSKTPPKERSTQKKLTSEDYAFYKNKAIDLFFNKGIKTFNEIYRMIPEVNKQTLRQAIGKEEKRRKDAISEKLFRSAEKITQAKVAYNILDEDLVVDTFVDGTLTTVPEIAKALEFTEEFVAKTLKNRIS